MIIVAIHLIIDNSNMVHIKEINGVIIAKTITLETLLEKLQEALQSNNTVSTPYLPINTVKYQKINEAYRIAIFYPATTRPYNYHGHVFKDTPFPNLLFIFTVQDKRITDARVAAVRDLVMRSTTKLYRYPYSHVYNSLQICFGNNVLPDIEELTQLPSVCELFLAMECNDDLYSLANKSGLVLRELLETSQGKPFDPDILIETNNTLEDFFFNDNN